MLGKKKVRHTARLKKKEEADYSSCYRKKMLVPIAKEKRGAHQHGLNP